MRRLESTAVAGYFPTPLRVATAIARRLGAERPSGRRSVRLLDSCAGTGEAAGILAQSVDAESFRHRVERGRAATAREELSHALHTNAFSVRISHGARSCLFLNPSSTRFCQR